MTYYEIWQQQKYGNILRNSDEQPTEYENETERFTQSSYNLQRDYGSRQGYKEDNAICEINSRYSEQNGIDD